MSKTVIHNLTEFRENLLSLCGTLHTVEESAPISYDNNHNSYQNITFGGIITEEAGFKPSISNVTNDECFQLLYLGMQSHLNYHGIHTILVRKTPEVSERTEYELDVFNAAIPSFIKVVHKTLWCRITCYNKEGFVKL